jgi:4-hydroxybenzoate polyprenyltransferase
MNLKNLLAYLNERFPFVNMALFAILFATVFSVASRAAAGAAGLLLPFGFSELAGMLATISFFFRLRVFDEIKDFASDAVLYPQRVLQSGRVSLRQLQALAWAGAALELAWSLHRGWPAALGWLLAVGYSLVMRYEFGVADWLRARLLLYAVSHMLIMPLVIGWLWLAYAPWGLFWSAEGVLLALLSLLGGFAFELARKIRTPAAEREGVDSYSKTLGYGGAIGAVLLVLLGSATVQGRLFWKLGAGRWPFILLAGLLLLTLATYGTALLRPREKLVRVAELLVSLAMLVSYVAVIVSLRW